MFEVAQRLGEHLGAHAADPGGQLVIALRALGQCSLVQAHPFAADRVQQLTGRADSEKRVVLGLALRTSTGGCASAHDVLPGVQRTFGCLLPNRKRHLQGAWRTKSRHLISEDTMRALLNRPGPDVMALAEVDPPLPPSTRP